VLWLQEGAIATLKIFVDDIHLDEFLSPLRAGISEVFVMSHGHLDSVGQVRDHDVDQLIVRNTSA